jgi:hypothetical protein
VTPVNSLATSPVIDPAVVACRRDQGTAPGQSRARQVAPPAILAAARTGLGGGSHVYANTLYVPPRKFRPLKVYDVEVVERSIRIRA